MSLVAMAVFLSIPPLHSRACGPAAAACPGTMRMAARVGDRHAPCKSVRQPGRPKAISVRWLGAGSRRNAASLAGSQYEESDLTGTVIRYAP